MDEPTFCTRMDLKLKPKYSSQLAIRLKWRQVLDDARKLGWSDDVHPAAITPQQLTQLAALIDNAFLDGQLMAPGTQQRQQHQQLAPHHGARTHKRGGSAGAGARAPHPQGSLRFTLEPCYLPASHQAQTRSVCAAFKPDANEVVVFQDAWGFSPSLQAPMQCDGVYTFSRLEWLAHALAHEMTHALMRNLCAPDPQHAALGGHGPVFRRLNLGLFGYHGLRYHAGWVRRV